MRAAGENSDRETKLTVHVLGACAATVGGPFGVVDVVLTNRKARALLGILAISDQPHESRERLCSLFWPDSSPANAKHSLRMAAYEVRTALQAAGFKDALPENFRNEVVFNRARVTVDLLDVHRDLDAGIVNPLLLLHERLFDRLFEGVETVSEEFQTLVRAKRPALERRARERLEDLLRAPTTSKVVRDNAAVALTMLDPSNEEATRLRMLSRADSGDVFGALALYDALVDHLKTDYSASPSSATRALGTAIRRQQQQQHPPGQDVQDASVAAPTADTVVPLIQLVPGTKLVINVGIFNTNGVPQDNRYFVDGFRGELVTSLLKFREWQVRDLAVTPRADGASTAFPGEYLITAGGIQAGNAVRVNLMLNDACTGESLPGFKAIISVTDWFTNQDDIIRQIATRLNVSVSAARLAALERAGSTGSPLIHDLVLRASLNVNAFETTSWRAAEAQLQDILRRDPKFPRTYAFLASLSNTQHYAFPGTFRTRDVAARAIELAQTATKLDPEDPRGHLSLGYAYALAGLYDLAASHFQLAHGLNESDPWVALSASTGLGVSGDVERARLGTDAALRLTPTPSEQHWGYLATVHFLAGDFANVIKVGARAPSPIYMPGLLAAAHAHEGQQRNAAIAAGILFARARQRWVGPHTPSRREISAWFLQLIPLRSEIVWRSLRDGLHAAGGECSDVDRSRWPNLADTDAE